METLLHIENDLKGLTTTLFELAKESCTNTLNNNCVYIATDIDYYTPDYRNYVKNCHKDNAFKKPIGLKAMCDFLQPFYNDIYDINFYVYKAKKNSTIIEVAYFLKTSINNDFYKSVVNCKPMKHCKILLPIYIGDSKKKFDINWQHGGFRHKWHYFKFRYLNKRG